MFESPEAFRAELNAIMNRAWAGGFMCGVFAMVMLGLLWWVCH